MAVKRCQSWPVIAGLVLLPGVVAAQLATAPAPSPTIPGEPQVTFFGVARADCVLIAPVGTTPDGIPIYDASAASGFTLVVEGRPGSSQVLLGASAFSSDVTQLPDLQIEASRALGNGSPAVCDDSGATQGGVPAVSPFDFSPAAAAAINDLACRFQDGQGQPVGRRDTSDACTLFLPEAEYHFVDPDSTIQFCALIDRPLSFPSGDTVVATRIRDTAGNVSAVAQLIVRVAPVGTATRAPNATRTPTTPKATATQMPITPKATATRVSITPTPSVTPTPTASPRITATIPAEPQITFFGAARADCVLIAPAGTTPDGIPIYDVRAGSGFTLVVEGRPGSSQAVLGASAFSSDVTQLPDLQIEASRALGNGSPAVCDDSGATQGGVPAVNPFDFSPAAAAAINDLACRFQDGQGQPVGRRDSSDACTLFLPEAEYHFVDPDSTIQFCAFVDQPLSFPSGDTVVAARVRDTAGNVSAVAELDVHVGTTPLLHETDGASRRVARGRQHDAHRGPH
jgi:hypothetical protein